MTLPLAKLDELEAAIKAGELEQAGELLHDLRPLLVSRNADELLQLRSRIDQLTIAAEAQRAKHHASLQRVAKNRACVASYTSIQQSTR